MMRFGKYHPHPSNNIHPSSIIHHPSPMRSLPLPATNQHQLRVVCMYACTPPYKQLVSYCTTVSIRTDVIKEYIYIQIYIYICIYLSITCEGEGEGEDENQPIILLQIPWCYHPCSFLLCSISSFPIILLNCCSLAVWLWRTTDTPPGIVT